MSKPPSRNNSKIITRNQGGGDKLQGLAPLATQFFISQANNFQYRTESGDGRNRNLIMCVNQLGGIGRGRSQFRGNADGKRGQGCDNSLETFKTYLKEINDYIQNTALPNAFINKDNIIGPYNDFSKYELCLVGNSESLVSDICANGISSEYITISNEGFGKTSNNRLFTHLLSVPHQQNPSIHSLITDPYKISYWNGSSWSNSSLSNNIKNINVQAIQKQITWCNNYIKTYSGTSYLFTNQNILTTLGYHTLGLINNNVTFPSNGPNATTFLQNLSGNFRYGIPKVFNPPTNSPFANNRINIFNSTIKLWLHFKLVPSTSSTSSNYIILKITGVVPGYQKLYTSLVDAEDAGAIISTYQTYAYLSVNFKEDILEKIYITDDYSGSYKSQGYHFYIQHSSGELKEFENLPKNYIDGQYNVLYHSHQNF
jgi:hypothetical protein